MSSHEQEEYLEQLWHMREKGLDTLGELQSRMRGTFDNGVIQQICSDALAEFSSDKEKITLTPQGVETGRRIVRGHRLAERLLNDVLGIAGERSESTACAFEHIIAPTLVDSICTLLGHPKECPHGKPIPEGECCSKRLRLVTACAIPLTQLEVSESARVSFIKCDRDEQMHRLQGLLIQPGVQIKIHQVFPTYVIECEGSMIALDEAVAANIHVWPGTS